MTVLSAEGGVDYVDGNTEETVEGLLNYRRRSQASCIYTRIRGNIDPLGISKEELKHAECECECERITSYFRRARNKDPRLIWVPSSG